MKKVLLITAAASVGGLIVSTFTHPIEAKGAFTTNLFKALSPYDEKYSKLALKILTSYTLIKNTGSLDLTNKIIKSGFDSSGQCLRGLELLGLSGVEIGPVTLNPTEQYEELGALHAKANINSYLEQFHSSGTSQEERLISRNQRIRSFKIGVNLVPDEEIFQYTPYLINENLTNSLHKIVKAYQQLPEPAKQQISEPQRQYRENLQKQYSLIDFITIDRGYIMSRIDQQIEKQTSEILDNLIKSSETMVRQAKVALYKTEQQNHCVVYLPPIDKSGVVGYNPQYSFVSWKDIVAEIIS